MARTNGACLSAAKVLPQDGLTRGRYYFLTVLRQPRDEHIAGPKRRLTCARASCSLQTSDLKAAGGWSPTNWSRSAPVTSRITSSSMAAMPKKMDGAATCQESRANCCITSHPRPALYVERVHGVEVPANDVAKLVRHQELVGVGRQVGVDVHQRSLGRRQLDDVFRRSEREVPLQQPVRRSDASRPCSPGSAAHQASSSPAH
jgi:hypothetical protein